MIISRTSPVTGDVNVMDLDVTVLELWNWKRGQLCQNAMPHLNADEREFLITGMTPSDWDNAFPPEEEDDQFVEFSR